MLPDIALSEVSEQIGSGDPQGAIQTVLDYARQIGRHSDDLVKSAALASLDAVRGDGAAVYRWASAAIVNLSREVEP